MITELVIFHFPEYKLIAFISHMGTSTMVGHYVCHVLHEGRWVIFNDNKVTLLTLLTTKKNCCIYIIALIIKGSVSQQISQSKYCLFCLGICNTFL
jgi:ubiquitin C-terminal hydrolase